MNRPIGIAITLFALGMSSAGSSSADPPADDAAQDASKHFERGIKLSEEEDWRAALIEFERAYAVDPNYRVLFDIGQCLYQLKDYPGALASFQRYLAAGAGRVQADRRAEVESDIEVLKGRVASVRVSSAIAGAEIRVDDIVVGTTPLASPIVVSAGRRKLTMSKAGMPTVTRYVDLAGEETAEAKLDPDAVVNASPAPPVASAALVISPEPSSALRPRSPSLLPAWFSFGVGAVGVGVGAIFGVTAMNDKGDLDRQCVAKSCPSTSQSLISASQRDSLVSTLGFGAGIAGAAVGVAYLVFAPGAHARSAGPSMGLVVDPQFIGAAGTFDHAYHPIGPANRRLRARRRGRERRLQHRHWSRRLFDARELPGGRPPRNGRRCEHRQRVRQRGELRRRPDDPVLRMRTDRDATVSQRVHEFHVRAVRRRRAAGPWPFRRRPAPPAAGRQRFQLINQTSMGVT